MIESTFRDLKAKNESALIGYITAGIPTPEDTVDIAKVLIRGGVDILELGVPFSDPIADGPTIQAAAHQALTLGITVQKVFNMVEEIKGKHNVPICLLTYYNPIYHMGIEKFMETSQRYGVNGLIVPDLPVEESKDYQAAAKKHNIDTIFLASPATSAERFRKIEEVISGFLYIVSLYGVTGARSSIDDNTLNLVKRFKQYSLGNVNLAVGFGISKPEHVKQVLSAGADGAIVGSAFVKIINQGLSKDVMLEQLEKLAFDLKQPTKS
ncbi:tryptophan synthase subunit alpha [Thermoproteota archaeon]